MSGAVARSLSRVWTIAANTFREAIRMRLLLLLGFVALASLVGGFVFREFNLGASELKFIADFGFGAMTLFGSAAAIVATAQLIYGEIEHRTIMPLLAKPVGRMEFLFGKLLGAWLTVCCFVGVIACCLMLALWVREAQLATLYPDLRQEGNIVSYGNVMLFALAQTWRLAIVASLTAFFASYGSSSLFAVFMGFFAWLLGQLHAVAAAQALRAESWLAEAALRSLSVALPDLRLFDLGEDVIGGAAIGASLMAKLFIYALLYSALYAGFAGLILRKREF